MSVLRIGILAGGKPDALQASMKNANETLRALEGHKSKIIFVDKSGILHEDGIPLPPESLSYRYDVLVNLLHPDTMHLEGVSRTLGHLKVPHTGSTHVGHALASDPSAIHHHLVSHGIKTPFGFSVTRTDDGASDVRSIFQKIGLPFQVSTPSGIYVIKTAPSLAEVIKKTNPNERLWVEESLSGNPVSVFVIENFRNTEHYGTLPVNEDGDIPRLSFEVKKQLDALAKKAHKALPVRHYSEVLFCVHPRRGVLCMGVNAHPETGEGSRLGKALGHAGASIKDFWTHIVTLAKNR